MVRVHVMLMFYLMFSLVVSSLYTHPVEVSPIYLTNKWCDVLGKVSPHLAPEAGCASLA